MKIRILALVLGCLLLCSGCTAMLERNHSSTTSHVDYSIIEDSSILRAESYQALLNSLLYFVNEHVGSGTIRLYNYTGNVAADLQRACNEVTEDDPLGAYAVDTIKYESTRILTYYEVKFTIAYRRSIAEVAEIRTVSGIQGVRQELKRMAGTHAAYATLRTAYFSGNAQLVADLFWLSFYSAPSSVLELPELTVSFYPEDGTQRILEVEADWPVTSTELTEYSRALSTSAAALVSSITPAGGQYSLEELAVLLHSHVSYDPSGSHTALAALQGSPVNDLGVLLAMEFLCQQHGIEVSAVSDTSGAQMWLIVLTPSGYRHLLPRDLRPDVPVSGVPSPDAPEEPSPEPTDPVPTESTAPEGDPQTDTPPDTEPQEPAVTEAWQLPLYTDEELAAMGFDWPRDLHPACVDYSGTVSE